MYSQKDGPLWGAAIIFCSLPFSLKISAFSKRKGRAHKKNAHKSENQILATDNKGKLEDEEKLSKPEFRTKIDPVHCLIVLVNLDDTRQPRNAVINPGVPFCRSALRSYPSRPHYWDASAANEEVCRSASDPRCQMPPQNRGNAYGLNFGILRRHRGLLRRRAKRDGLKHKSSESAESVSSALDHFVVMVLWVFLAASDPRLEETISTLSPIQRRIASINAADRSVNVLENGMKPTQSCLSQNPGKVDRYSWNVRRNCRQTNARDPSAGCAAGNISKW
ncbi:hypothetical protein K438DRAFT_2128519 [Mycena galopus ATCC 62051]|nr:hypothetical protein K438DRAFT_2128519 [Mycena galopus ATCC 62051]